MMIGRLRNKIVQLIGKRPYELDPIAGYGKWADSYESKENLMQHLDKELVQKMLTPLQLDDITVLDYGCGTGRHWPYLKSLNITELIGCDTSKEMIAQLEKKYPDATTHVLGDTDLSFLNGDSIELIFSTLTIGHIPRLEPVCASWTRVAKPGGYLLITGNHPQALAQGITRSFISDGQEYRVNNVLHRLDQIRDLLGSLSWHECSFHEVSVSAEHKGWFEDRGALKSYREILGTPVLYSMLWHRQIC